ncbi:MAG: YdeI/OmpD-associated family protein [Terriglobales bacterium]
MPKASRAKPTPAAKRFEARLERLRSNLNWIIVRIPFDAAKLWGLRGQIKVKGEINGFAFRTSLFPTREGWHFLLVNKRMQKGARAFEGSVARFQMEFDSEERIVTIPEEFKRLLSQDRSLRRWYDELNPSTRNDIAKWITEPKGAEARVRRAEQIAERLLSVMEAERELPPILQVAFARHPRAREGWDRMSPSRRRGHLFGIFYYRTPDAQARRVDKMLEDATEFAEKMSDKKKK